MVRWGSSKRSKIFNDLGWLKCDFGPNAFLLRKPRAKHGIQFDITPRLGCRVRPAQSSADVVKNGGRVSLRFLVDENLHFRSPYASQSVRSEVREQMIVQDVSIEAKFSESHVIRPSKLLLLGLQIEMRR
jgi:hypothetical protein